MLELVPSVNARIQYRKLFEYLFLQFPPHVGKATLDLKVDHYGCHCLTSELGVRVFDFAQKPFFIRDPHNHSDMLGEVVSNQKLQAFAQHGSLLS